MGLFEGHRLTTMIAMTRMISHASSNSGFDLGQHVFAARGVSRAVLGSESGPGLGSGSWVSPEGLLAMAADGDGASSPGRHSYHHAPGNTIFKNFLVFVVSKPFPKNIKIFKKLIFTFIHLFSNSILCH